MKKGKQYRWRPAYMAIGMAVALGSLSQVGYAAPEEGATTTPAVVAEQGQQAAPISIAGKKMTGFSWTEEVLARVDKLVPYNIEESIQQRGARYSKALLPFVSNAVVDGNLVTGPAWPAHPEWMALYLKLLGTKIEA